MSVVWLSIGISRKMVYSRLDESVSELYWAKIRLGEFKAVYSNMPAQLCNIYTHYLNSVRKRCSFLDRNGSFSCEVRYLMPVVYSHFTMTIAIKYWTTRAKPPCPSKEATPFCAHRSRSMIHVHVYKSISQRSPIVGRWSPDPKIHPTVVWLSVDRRPMIDECKIKLFSGVIGRKYV